MVLLSFRVNKLRNCSLYTSSGCILYTVVLNILRSKPYNCFSVLLGSQVSEAYVIVGQMVLLTCILIFECVWISLSFSSPEFFNISV